MLLPFSSVCASFVFLCPCAVDSLLDWGQGEEAVRASALCGTTEAPRSASAATRSKHALFSHILENHV